MSAAGAAPQSQPDLAGVAVGVGLLTLFPGRVGGSETYNRGVLEQFAAGRTGGARMLALANRAVAADAGYRSLATGPVLMRRVRSYRAGRSSPTRLAAMLSARAAPSLAARAVPRGLDLVHHPFTVPIPALPGTPVVTTLFDLQHHDLPAFFSAAERRFRRWAYDDAARRADALVTASAHARDRAVEVLGVDPERTVVAPAGLDRDRFRPDADPDRDAAALAGLPVPERFAIYPANLWPHKNHGRLVEALGRCRDRDLALVLTGQTYGREGPLLDVARRAGVTDRVHHLGFVSPAALPALLRRAVAMVFPSLYEGFGAPPLEAMACGCPVASSTRASLAEVVADAALTFDPESVDDIARALDAVAGDGAVRDRLRVAGLANVERFSWTACADATLGAYALALGRGSG